MKLIKYKGNPIIRPNQEHPWESLVTTNPAVYYDEQSEKFIMLYRVAGNDKEHRINLALAESRDGFSFVRKSKAPLFQTYEGAWDEGSIEDPRIVKMGEYYFITYATVPLPPGQYWTMAPGERFRGDFLPKDAPYILRRNETRTGLAITKDFQTIYRPGYLTDPTLDDRDVILFPEKIDEKYVLLHRPMQWVGKAYGTEYPAIWMSKCDDLLGKKEFHFFAKAEYEWEVKIGGAAPPIKTEYGWFMLYHAVGPDKKYRVGAMLLDLENPLKIIGRTREPILEPEYDYENEGLYKGICFPCGNVVKDGKLYVYYGGADQYVGVATCKFEEILQYLKENPQM